MGFHLKPPGRRWAGFRVWLRRRKDSDSDSNININSNSNSNSNSNDTDTKDSPSTLLKLPQELLDEILKYLPPLSHWLLALTCKTLYYRLGSVFSSPAAYSSQYITSKAKHLPHTLTPFFQNENEDQSEYVNFLLRLEDPRWKYCQFCSKLHPRSAWQEPTRKEHRKIVQLLNARDITRDINTSDFDLCEELAEITYRMRDVYIGYKSANPCEDSETPALDHWHWANLNLNPLPQNHTCAPWAGAVKICKCFSMAFHHRKKMIDILNILKERPLQPQVFFGTVLFSNTDILPLQYLLHECPETSTRFGNITRITAFFLHKGNLLVLKNTTLHLHRSEMMPECLWPLPRGSWSRNWQIWAQGFDNFCEQPEKLLSELKNGLMPIGSQMCWWARPKYRGRQGPELPERIHLPKVLDLGNGESPSMQDGCQFQPVGTELIFPQSYSW